MHKNESLLLKQQALFAIMVQIKEARNYEKERFENSGL